MLRMNLMLRICSVQVLATANQTGFASAF